MQHDAEYMPNADLRPDGAPLSTCPILWKRLAFDQPRTLYPQEPVLPDPVQHHHGHQDTRELHAVEVRHPPV